MTGVGRLFIFSLCAPSTERTTVVCKCPCPRGDQTSGTKKGDTDSNGWVNSPCTAGITPFPGTLGADLPGGSATDCEESLPVSY